VSHRFVVVLFVGLLAACVGTGASPDSTALPTTTTEPATTTTTTLPDCSPLDSPAPGTFDASTASELSVMLSELRFDCAHEAIVTAGTLPAIRAGAALASEEGLPVLVDGSGVDRELERLGVGSVRWVGLAPAPRFAADTTVVSPSDVTATPPMHPPEPEVVWVFDGDPNAVPLLQTVAAVRGEGFVDVSEVDDIRRADPDVLALLRGRSTIAAALDAERTWQLEVVQRGLELPGGGYTFDGKRLVAFYGNPTTRALGVLGEQDPAGTLVRMAPIVEEYSADGLQGVPTFEIIATIASAQAGADGDYSEEMSADTLRPWIDFAAEHGVYVVLDLQPGRTDFLTQAQRYEEFLRLPHVGLALDPEWRLGPNQVHLRQIGTVDTTEINQVSDWLAGIVREERLPQKLLLVHQFRFSMITNRELLETPPELFTVIQMDGQGPLPTKYQTYAAITAGQEEVGWSWGWKNFYDEDSPMATAAEVLAVEPVVVFVSFQ
jgi:hypothetical protein